MSAKRKTKSGIFRGVLSTVFLLAALALVVVFLVFRDSISADTIRGIRQLIPFASESESLTEEVSFDAGLKNLYGFYDGKLAVLSGERLALYGSSGAETLSRAVSMENPALETSGGMVMAYDRGGAFLISDGKDVLLELDGPVMGARFNSRQWFTVITREPGYRGIVTVYDNKCKRRYDWYSAGAYILDAAVSPNGKHLAVASVSQKGESLTSHITLHDISKEDPEHEIAIKDRLALSVLYPDNNHVCAIAEDGAEFYDNEGERLGAYSAGDGVFAGYASGEDFLVMNTKRAESAQISELVVLDYDGNQISRLSVSGEIKAVSAQGGYFSVLAGSVLDIYNAKCEKIDSFADCASVREIAQQADGSVYLLSGDNARLYTPGKR